MPAGERDGDLAGELSARRRRPRPRNPLGMFAFLRLGNPICGTTGTPSRDWTPDVSDITSTAVQLAKKKGKSPAAQQLKDPKKMAAAGAALMALPFAAEGIAKLAGGSPKAGGKAKEVGEKAK